MGWVCSWGSRTNYLMISLSWKHIISYMNGREAFNALLLAVVAKSLDGKCKWRFPCPGGSMKILIFQLAPQEPRFCCLSACSCPFGCDDWSAVSFSTLSHTSCVLEQKVWDLPCADLPVVQQLGSQRWSWYGCCFQRQSSLGKKRHVCQNLWSKWTEESLRGAEWGWWKNLEN